MNHRGLMRLLESALLSGDEFKFLSTATPKWLPDIDDTAMYIGDGTNSWDMRLYGSAAANYISWDASANRFKFEDNVELHFGTNTAGQGTAGDLYMRWDGTDFDILQSTANSSISLGVDGAGIDLVLYGDTASANMTWDQSADALIFSGAASIQGQRNSTAGATAITTTRVMTLADSGGIFTVNQGAAYDIDLPSPTTGAGCRYIFQLVGPASNTVTITVTGSAATFEGVIVNDVTSVLPCTGSTLTFVSGVAALGDCIEVISTSATKYFVRAICSANGGITIA